MISAIKQKVKGMFGWNHDFDQGGQVPPWYPAEYFQRGMPPLNANGLSSVAFAAADTPASMMALAIINLVKINPDNSYTVLRGTPISRLLRNPNGYQTISDIMMHIGFSFIMQGNVVFLITRDKRGAPIQIHPVNWRSAQPMIVPDTKEIFYSIGNNPMIPESIEMLVPQRDIIHIRAHTPNHPLMGVSCLEYAAMSSGVNLNILSDQSSFFSNMSRPSGVLSTDITLTKDQILQLREAWEAQSAGLNSGKVPILGGGLKWQQMTLTSTDAQLIETLKWTVEDIARVTRVPLPLLGSTENASYNNVEQLISLYLSTGLGFLIEHVEAAFTKAFALPDTQKIEFDVSPLLRVDMKGRVGAMADGIRSGLYTINEARSRENLPSVKGGDEPLVQSQMVPVSIAVAPPTPPEPTVPPNEPADEVDDTEAAKYLMKRVSNG